MDIKTQLQHVSQLLDRSWRVSLLFALGMTSMPALEYFRVGARGVVFWFYSGISVVTWVTVVAHRRRLNALRQQVQQLPNA